MLDENVFEDNVRNARSDPATVPGTGGSCSAEGDGVEAMADAVALAERLLGEGGSGPGGPGLAGRRARRLARLAEDPEARRFAFLLTDRVTRPEDRRVAARQLRRLTRQPGIPASFAVLDRLGLAVAGRLGPAVPSLVMPLVDRRIRAEAGGVVVEGGRRRLGRHLRTRRSEGFRANVNVLGEAVLGHGEACRRLDAVVAALSRPDVDYVSVKLSAIEPNLSVLAFEDSVERAVARLRTIVRAAAAHRPAKFVNLDMEEYRDLWLTVEAFRRLLDEEEFRAVPAGIALQAYLPDTSAALDELAAWACRRSAAGGAAVKVRLVKGANLAMELVDAELHGWEPAPYPTKADVDAHYKALLDRCLRPELAGALRVGVASHNVYDLAWALTLAERRGAADRIDLEMLEGMAPELAAALAGRGWPVVLYTPVAERKDFRSALAYLARRLDENTSPENFLAVLHRVGGDPSALAEQRRRFLGAVEGSRDVDHAPRRRQDRFRIELAAEAPAGFANEPDTDFTAAANRAWVHDALETYRRPALPEAVTTTSAVDAVVAEAAAAARRWAARPASERRAMLHRVAGELAARRGRVIAAMVAEAAKVVGEADSEVSEAVDFARYYADGAISVEELVGEGLRFEPYGVVVVTPPWNFPFAIPAGGVLAALAAGNAVILKPAPQTPAVAYELAEAAWHAGVPRDVLQYARCSEDEVGRHLVGHDGVAGVILTGSWDTAQQFCAWRQGRAVHAETSGKNALVVSATADIDAAVSDLVRSAFGHAGQKCSAASLAIVDRRVLDGGTFLRQLADAVRSLPVGPAHHLDTVVGPLIGAPEPGDPLHRALTELDPGERWLVAPERLSDDGRLWRPGVRLGVAPGSWFHSTECFGPVLGVMRAESLAEATSWQNAVAFGLTGGLHSLDEAEIAWWLERVEVGNAYVNRATTGAIVRRQPFGGWKRSVVGPGAKAGGPNYAMSLGRWADEPGAPAAGSVDAARASYRHWWETHFALDHDPTGLRAERNVFRYRRLPRGVLLWWDGTEPWSAVARALVAAEVTATPVELSCARPPAEETGVITTVESDAQLVERLPAAAGRFDRFRVVGATTPALRDAARAAGLPLDASPVVGHGRVELQRWVREQAVSETRHRHGHVLSDR